jgi:hypothetical protein
VCFAVQHDLNDRVLETTIPSSRPQHCAGSLPTPDRKGTYRFVGVDPWRTTIQFGSWMVPILLVIFIVDRQNDFMIVLPCSNVRLIGMYVPVQITRSYG